MSTALPAFYTRVYVSLDPNGIFQPRYGIEALLFGWMGLFGGENVPWLANLCWAIAVVALLTAPHMKLWIAIVAATIGVGLAATFYFRPLVLLNATGIPSTAEAFGPGYWLWIGSLLWMFAASVAIRTLTSNADGEPSHATEPAAGPDSDGSPSAPAR